MVISLPDPDFVTFLMFTLLIEMFLDREIYVRWLAYTVEFVINTPVIFTL